MSKAAARMALALTALVTLAARADELAPICPDRPGKNTSACTVQPGHAQIELGLFDETTMRRSGVTTDVGNAGTALVKYGVSDSVDLEANLPLYQFQRVGGLGGRTRQEGLGDLTLYGKYNPLGPDSGSFTLVLEPYVKLPTATGGLGNQHVEGGALAPMNWDLGNDWSVQMTPEADILLNGSNSGYHGQLVNVVGLNKAFGPLSLGTELWTSQNLDPGGTVSQYSFDLTVAYLTDNDTQLDTGLYLGLNRATPDAEFYVGISRRF